MIDLGTTDFLIQVPSLPEAELASLSSSLFDSWESFVEHSLAIHDYSLFLQVEEGSIKGLARTGAFLYAVYLGIGNYGGFVSGLQTINDQLKATRDYLADETSRMFPCKEERPTVKNRGGSLAALQRIFVRVQRNELTPDEAMILAESLLGEEAATVPGFRNDLENALRTCPHFPTQLSLLPEDNSLSLVGSKRPSRLPRPTIDFAPSMQFRVEISRESKKKSKQTRIIRL